MLLLAVLCVVGGVTWYLAEQDSDDDEAPAEQPAMTQQPEGGPELGRSFQDKEAGIAVRWPAGWRRAQRDGGVLLRSRDRCAALSFSAPAAAADARALRETAIDEVEAQYPGSRTRRNIGKRRIGGVETSGAVVDVKSGKNGPQARVLIAVGTGKQRAYLSEIVFRDLACSETLVEAQLILASARFTK